MGALEFLKELVRMCNSMMGCTKCPLFSAMSKYHVTCSELMKRYPEEAIMFVEQWSKEHPIKTNARKFKEVFGLPPHCMIDKDAQWWDEPYEEPKDEAMR